MKKAFSLLFTILIVTILSLVSINIFQSRAINNQNTINQYLYIQANNHLNFLQEYINSIKNLKNNDEIKIESNRFDIIAKVKKDEKNTKIIMSVKSKDYNIRVQRTLIK
ncbi:hypothetical protein CPU12_04575 [Malaciobacter molluscorum LMG 25693]|uniref:Transformation system protein n=1 Tax=Malaciobacter molluscorum LMG 25693 TaxID=870501 RepID=A0A2G1DJ71_9BACT|nr:hypothetical protein [Malaciobacter molluscorum]AXX91646.1 hypothetical protein AMOL_0646 [Malaciobacter molluscorum LMG 25693]PHO18559.1 hypothetical protein CPU12_04575 [Malaciobacter molluscorum LMG 25693]